MKDLHCESNESRRNTLKYGRRVFICCVIMAVCVVFLTAQSGKITAKDQKAAEAITAAITALGGEKNINNIKSLILTGTTRYYAGVSVRETEIRILLPDNYLRIDKQVDGSTLYTRASKGESQNAGINGTGGRMGMYISNEVNRFASLLMGLLLKGDPIAPVALTAVTGESDRFSIAKETEMFGEIEFDPARKYPVLIRYKDVFRNIYPTTTALPTGRVNISFGYGAEEINDSVLRFNDRVAVDGVMFPRTIVFESNGKVDKELIIEKVQVNPKLSLADFEIPEY